MKRHLASAHQLPESRYRTSPDTEKRIGDLVAKYPNKMAATIPVLHAIQDEIGQISKDAAVYAACGGAANVEACWEEKAPIFLKRS